MLSARWKGWRAAAIGMASEPAPKPSPLQKRLDWLVQTCSLNPSQSWVLGLLARATQSPPVRTLIESVDDRFGIRFEGVDGSDLYPFLETSSERGELSAAGRLSQLGLIEAREAPRLSVVVRRLLSLPRFGARRVGDLLLGEPARASLAWIDFEHLGDLRDLVGRIAKRLRELALARSWRAIKEQVHAAPRRASESSRGRDLSATIRRAGSTDVCQSGDGMSAIEGQKPIFRRSAPGFACASCSSHCVKILGSRSSSAPAFLSTVAKSAGVKALSLSTNPGGLAPNARRYASAI
jgi:hypothetical protein